MTNSIKLHQITACILLLACLLLACRVGTGWAATAETKYYAAERCYQQLRNNSSQQKFRHRWLNCINKFLAVHKHDPRGPWAAAGLYQAGVLYAGLYDHSFFAPDRQEAIDIFDRVMDGYPKSQYRNKAEHAKLRLLKMEEKQGDLPQERTSARDWYEKGEAHYQRLQKTPRLKKYRDQWMRCIQNYRQAYQAEPEGPLAAAALFGLARCYSELYQHSFQALDRVQSDKSYQEIVRKYPDSPYAQKAKAALGQGGDDPDDDAGSDAIANVIQHSDDPTYEKEDATSGFASMETPASVEGLRFWSNPRYTRVVIDADKDTVFSYHELREDPSIGKPQRIYIDVHNSRLGKGLQKVVPINDNLLRDARAGQYAQDKVRVVVDIKSFETYKIFSLKNPYRIVLDVWGVGSQEEQPSALSVPIQTGKGKLQPGAIAKQLALGVRRIVIDPGHGGKDYGAPGFLKGVHEKHVALEIAKRLKGMIRSQLRCEVILTRAKDHYLSLEERTAIANTHDADLFISIHTNASRDHRAYGIETYILNLATDDEAIRVAARENATSTKNISDLDTILGSLMNNAKVSESSRLASYVQQSIIGGLKAKYNHMRNKGIKQAPFYVLLGASMPSILIETSFISNQRECQRLNSADYQKRLCQGIVNGIKHYIQDTNPTALRFSTGGKG
jgi:N-acetylmuramoyl-L-alanine amidase